MAKTAKQWSYLSLLGFLSSLTPTSLPSLTNPVANTVLLVSSPVWHCKTNVSDSIKPLGFYKWSIAMLSLDAWLLHRTPRCTSSGSRRYIQKLTCWVKSYNHLPKWKAAVSELLSAHLVRAQMALSILCSRSGVQQSSWEDSSGARRNPLIQKSSLSEGGWLGIFTFMTCQSTHLLEPNVV